MIKDSSEQILLAVFIVRESLNLWHKGITCLIWYKIIASDSLKTLHMYLVALGGSLYS